MEKFGIFELLDTLSALGAAAAAGTEQEHQPAPAPPAQEGAEAGRQDGAQEGAAAGRQNGRQEGVQEAPPPPDRGRSALSAFLARHDEVRHRAEKQK